MRTATWMALVLTCALSLDAQITAKLNRLPDGLDEVRIRNDSATSLVAFVVTAKPVPRNGATREVPVVVYSDTLIDKAAKPLLPREERVAMLRGVGFSDPVRGRGMEPGRRSIQEPILAAGIFADGATTGDVALLARLLMRRSNMLLAVEMSLETLADAGRHNVPRDQMIKQFRKMADSARRWYLPPEQRVGLLVYQSMVGKLMNLPDVQLGTPFPPATFVAQETAMLNRQRVELLESQPGLADGAFLESIVPNPAAQR